MNRRLPLALLMLPLCAALGACSTPITAPLDYFSGVHKLPIIGGSSDLQTESVRSIRTLTVNRIAAMPIVETPDKSDNVVAEGAGEAISAELFSEMSLLGGWEVVPDSDVEQAMQKLPPSTAGNLEDNALALGRQVSADAVIYGTVERYRERVGVDYAAASPAAVTFTLHMIDMKSQQVVWTAKFTKAQKALSENILNLYNFLQYFRALGTGARDRKRRGQRGGRRLTRRTGVKPERQALRARQLRADERDVASVPGRSGLISLRGLFGGLFSQVIYARR